MNISSYTRVAKYLTRLTKKRHDCCGICFAGLQVFGRVGNRCHGRWISRIRGGSRSPRIEIRISSVFMTVWNWPKMVLEWVSSPHFVKPAYVPTFKSFLAVTAQWNFLHSFLSSILPDVLGFISKLQIFVEKLALFRVRGLGTFFCDQYNFIVDF